jgi:hypothetical protein
MSAVPDVVSLVDWHFRRATRPTSAGEADRRADVDTDEPRDGSAGGAARG